MVLPLCSWLQWTWFGRGSEAQGFIFVGHASEWQCCKDPLSGGLWRGIHWTMFGVWPVLDIMWNYIILPMILLSSTRLEETTMSPMALAHEHTPLDSPPTPISTAATKICVEWECQEKARNEALISRLELDANPQHIV